MNIELARQQMVQQQVRTWDVFDATILRVLSIVPREQFVPAGLETLAFAETELPLRHGQRMMTPNVEGRMLQALDIKRTDSALEIGTGSGFITACLAMLAKSVTSIDLYEDFQSAAAANLEDSGISNFELQVMDATQQLPDEKYDVIIIGTGPAGLGAAFHLPTFYNIKETFYTDMQSTFDAQYNVSDIYLASPTNEFDYWLRTPWKAIGSVALQLGRVAIISVDYEYMDYRNASLDSRTTNYDLLDQNDRIYDIYTAAHNIRAGAELHLGPMYLRGGAAYWDSPYKKSMENGDSYYVTVNGGLGFRSEHVFFDLAYSLRVNEYKYWLYIPEDVNGAQISTNNNQIAATLGFRF